MFISSIEVSDWQAIGGMLTVLGAMGLKYLQEVNNNRRATQQDKEKLQVLRDISASNLQIREGQIFQNGKLEKAETVNEMHHRDLVTAIKATCRHL